MIRIIFHYCRKDPEDALLRLFHPDNDSRTSDATRTPRLPDMMTSLCTLNMGYIFMFRHRAKNTPPTTTQVWFVLISVVSKTKILNIGNYNFEFWKLSRQTQETKWKGIISDKLFFWDKMWWIHFLKGAPAGPPFSKLIIWKSQVPSSLSCAHWQLGYRSSRPDFPSIDQETFSPGEYWKDFRGPRFRHRKKNNWRQKCCNRNAVNSE